MITRLRVFIQFYIFNLIKKHALEKIVLDTYRYKELCIWIFHTLFSYYAHHAISFFEMFHKCIKIRRLMTTTASLRNSIFNFCIKNMNFILRTDFNIILAYVQNRDLQYLNTHACISTCTKSRRIIIRPDRVKFPSYFGIVYDSRRIYNCFQRVRHMLGSRSIRLAEKFDDRVSSTMNFSNFRDSSPRDRLSKLNVYL